MNNAPRNIVVIKTDHQRHESQQQEQEQQWGRRRREQQMRQRTERASGQAARLRAQEALL